MQKLQFRRQIRRKDHEKESKVGISFEWPFRFLGVYLKIIE